MQNLNILNADIYSANDHLVEGILADWANGSTVLNCYTSAASRAPLATKCWAVWSASAHGVPKSSAAVPMPSSSQHLLRGEDCDTVAVLSASGENSNGIP